MDDYRDLDDTIVKGLRHALETYDQAAVLFISKVESGQAYSKETYADLKAALKLSREAQAWPN